MVNTKGYIIVWNELKILSHKDILLSIFEKRNTYPLHVQIEITEACNHRCIFCPWHGNEKITSKHIDYTGKRHIDSKLLDRILKDLIQGGTKAIAFTGAGEPLLYPNIDEVLRTLVDAAIVEFALTTNLSVTLKDDTLRLLSHASWIRWSLNAGTTETYQSVHKPKNRGAFDTAIENVTKLVSLKSGQRLKIGTSFVIHPNNTKDIIKATELSKSIGVDSISFRPAISMFRQEQPIRYDKETLKALEFATSLADSNFHVYTNLGRLNDVKIVFDDSLLCYYSNHATHIISSGGVYPCCMTRYDRKYEIGNLNSTTFKDFWFSKERVKHHRNIKVKNCPPCRHTLTNEALHFIYKECKDNFI